MKTTFWAVAALTVLLLGFIAFAGGRERQRQERINPPTPTLSPQDRYVRYEIQGEGFSHITFTNDRGATEQWFEHLPYQLEFPVPSGQTITVAAKDGGYGEITCQIYISGAKVTENTATGKYSTATCTASVP